MAVYGLAVGLVLSHQITFKWFFSDVPAVLTANLTVSTGHCSDISVAYVLISEPYPRQSNHFD